MEAAATMKMVEDALHDFCFIIDVIVGDSDSTLRSVLKHSSIVS